jgi:hypothetical protein
VPTSVAVKQQLTAVSAVVQLVPLHLLAECGAKGSEPAVAATEQSELHATATAPVHRVARVFVHV